MQKKKSYIVIESHNEMSTVLDMIIGINVQSNLL